MRFELDRWRVLSIAVVLMGLGSVGVVVGTRPSAKEVSIAHGTLFAWMERHDATRDALWGETAEERAFPHYERALERSRAFDRDELWELRRAESDAQIARRAEVAGEALPLLEDLHRGAHARNAERELDVSRGFHFECYKLMDARHVTLLAELRAAVLLARGDELEAVSVLLDAMQFAGDLCQSSVVIEEMIGGAVLVPDLLRDWISDGTVFELSPAAFDRLVDGVDALDARLAWRSDSFPAEALCAEGELNARIVGGGEGLEGLPVGALPAWRIRYELPEFLVAARDGHRTYRRAFELPPAEALASLDELELELEGVRGAIAGTFLPTLASANRSRLPSIARLRLVAHVLSGRRAPRDPWLAELLRVERGDRGERLTLDHERFEHVELLVGG